MHIKPKGTIIFTELVNLHNVGNKQLISYRRLMKYNDNSGQLPKMCQLLSLKYCVLHLCI
jgi:hypothetical protein